MNKVIGIFLLISSAFAYADIPCTEADRDFSRKNSDLMEIKREVMPDNSIYFQFSFPSELRGQEFSHAAIAIGEVSNPDVILSLVSHESNNRRTVDVDVLDTWKSTFTVSVLYGYGCIGLSKTVHLGNE